MIAILPVFVLLLAAIIIITIRILKPGFSYYWLIAAGGTLMAWLGMLLATIQARSTSLLVPEATIAPLFLLPVSPALRMDAVSAPFALAITTLALAAMLTDIARPSTIPRGGSTWIVLESSLVISATAILTVLSGNLYTLLLGWSALDLLEVLVRLNKAGNGKGDEVSVALLPRLASLACIIYTGIIAASNGLPLSYDAITPGTNPYLLLAAGLRLGLIPVHGHIHTNQNMRLSLRTLLNLAPAASCLMLLVRCAPTGITENLVSLFLFLAGYAALYGSLSWAQSTNETDGQPYWIIGAGALVFASTVRAQPSASLAWGVALVFSGGAIFLFSPRSRWLTVIPLAGALFFSALPLTPTWAGVFLYAPPLTLILFIFLLSQGLLLGGYLGHTLRHILRYKPRTNPPSMDAKTGGGDAGGDTPNGAVNNVAERWVWLIYPAGLAFLPLTHFIAMRWGALTSNGISTAKPNLFDSLPAIAATMIAVLYAGFIMIRGRRAAARQQPPERRGITSLLWVMSASWLYRWTWRMYLALGRLFSLINILLEGRGSLLWVILLLILLLSIFIRWSASRVGIIQIGFGEAV